MNVKAISKKAEITNKYEEDIFNKVGNYLDNRLVTGGNGAMTIQSKDYQISTEKNHTWQCNHRLIVQVLTEYHFHSKQFPTTIELADLTNLSRKTISEHLNFFKQSEYYQTEISMIEGLALSVVVDLFANFKKYGATAMEIKKGLECLELLKPKQMKQTKESMKLSVKNITFR